MFTSWSSGANDFHTTLEVRFLFHHTAKF